MTTIDNPFVTKVLTPAEITEASNAQSLHLLRGICRRSREALEAVERVAPGLPLHFMWQDKHARAHADYLAFAAQLGIGADAAEAALAANP